MTTLQHYLRPLLAPASVALVGASDKPGSLGRIVFENLLDGGFKGELYAVNPSHRRVLGQRCFASLAAIGKPVDLALIAVPCAAVTGVLDDAARCGVKAAVILSAPPSTTATRGAGSATSSRPRGSAASVCSDRTRSA